MKAKTHVLENNSLGDDLCKLAQLLGDAGICKDVGPLDAAGKAFAKSIDEDKWSYKIPYLDFEIDTVGSILPLGCEELTLRFSIDVTGSFLNENLIADPFKDLSFDIEITGTRCDVATNEFCDIYCSWHLDRHIGNDDEKAKYSHPFYHLTFGGKKMEDKEFDGVKLEFGNILVMPSPRIAYPPMDAILGIDFILQNYLHKNKIKSLLINPEYSQIVSKSQDFLWKPYFLSIASKWGTFSDITYNNSYGYNKLFPFLR